MSENPQYDQLLGGNQELPSAIRLMQFTAARCKEIQTMKQSLASSKGGKLAFQKLPVHMRRRVMSHNAKRLPRRLREIHMNQLKKSGLGVKQKRPSRKYRRRPNNLLEEYKKRQGRHRWLETHIWHAKRFHMVEKWGYKLPQSPCDKAFRACYRASAKHCLLEDVSYIGCMEINGEENLIINNFNQLYDKNVNMSIGAKAFIKGNREGKLTLFTDGVPLGNINFQWKPREDGNLNRTMWIWVHAAFYQSVLNTLISTFNLGAEDNTCYENKQNKILLYDLRSELNRFRLTGPLSHAILQKSLIPADVTIENKNDWLNENFKEIFHNQVTYWQNLRNISSPAELSPHIIIGLCVSDPRYNMPKKRNKALSDNSQTPVSNLIETFTEELSISPVWNRSIRKYVKDNKISNSDLCKIRSQLLVPGTDLETPGMSVPYLLIQRPGNRTNTLGYCSGWDLILPSGWAQATWLALTMWGARSGGLREAESNVFEMGAPSVLEPDTEAGRTEDELYTKLHRKRYFSLPPNKRINYSKFSILSPFECKWNVLLTDWNCFPEGAKNFYVMRNRKTLQLLQENLTKNTPIHTVGIDFQVPCVVPVRLVLENKGIPKRYSIICLAKQRDLKFPDDIKEPLRVDEKQLERKLLRKSHKTQLKKLIRYKKQCRLSGKTFVANRDCIEEYKRKMSSLWLPEVQSGLKTSCSREIMGWVTKGDFSFTVGKSAAVGYVAMASLNSLYSSGARNKVLIRNTSSRQYRIATLNIVL